MSIACWMCGAIADSREHIFKARALRPLFAGGEKPYLVRKGRGSGLILGPDAGRVKYEPIICKRCNNERSQNFDNAMDLLLDWMEVNQLSQAATVSWRKILGDNYISTLDDLYRYFIKAMGCRLRLSTPRLPAHFPSPRLGRDHSRLKVSVCRLHTFNFDDSYNPSNFATCLAKGDVYADIDRAYKQRTGENLIRSAVWWENYGLFQISYWFDLPPHPDFGAVLTTAEDYPIAKSSMNLFDVRREMSAWVTAHSLPTFGAC